MSAQWPRYQPYEPEYERVRDHVLSLKKVGISGEWIAYQAVVDVAILHKLINRRTGVAAATAERIMAVRASDYDGTLAGLQIPALGVSRRLNSLRADGFSIRYLAPPLNRTEQRVSQLAAMASPLVYSATHNEVSNLYDKLAGTDPLDVLTSREVNRAKSYGLKVGGVPSIYWDSDALDDPDGFPDYTGACGTVKGTGLHRREDIPLCEPCRDARNEDRRDLKHGVREPLERGGGHDRGQWRDEALIVRLRADFEAWTDSKVMAERYGTNLGNLRAAATFDGDWTHPYALPDYHRGKVES